MYICPMHPEIRQEKKGRCPKCGMELVLESRSVSRSEDQMENTNQKTSYLPLIVIVGLIFGVALTISLRDGVFNLRELMTYFMAGFFITFAGFKLIDLKGFVQGYFTYDLLAKHWFSYGYLYPILELSFGLLMILGWQERSVLILEVLVMTFSGLGVAIKLLKKEKFQCVCLGTAFKLPLTYVTLIEDFGMAILALVLLFL